MPLHFFFAHFTRTFSLFRSFLPWEKDINHHLENTAICEVPWMEDVLHQLIGSLSHHLPGFYISQVVRRISEPSRVCLFPCFFQTLGTVRIRESTRGPPPSPPKATYFTQENRPAVTDDFVRDFLVGVVPPSRAAGFRWGGLGCG